MNKNSDSAGSLPLMEAFYTIQGEGYHQGTPAYFIRLGGCDVGCHWCDVRESWDVAGHPRVEPRDIVKQAVSGPSRIAVITGGEPCMHDLEDLTRRLHRAGFRNHLETSGAYPLTGKWDWICLSPKKLKPAQESVFPAANELKVIIYNRSDFKWAEEQREKVNDRCKLFLQPEWSKMNALMNEIVDYAKENPAWNISLQIHKFMNIP